MSAHNSPSKPQDAVLAARGRRVSMVIAGTMVLWFLAISIGPMLGLPGRYAFLFDFAALAGLFWALVVSLQIRRARKSLRDNE
ncbi:hypothetical protein ROLI_012320 [Roseobacter fucihabitans]|uniref:DUF5337 domain-containing protein n=1 Tax=Roseobacter fucihabitans TaxID=1537242 RepID=A0ABZ2BQ91_9RHOB|nr:DUF5337 domain-containing protein [Roseobacter litoralis]MBC6964240.1 hypothetical protein [Roseobacter litoralis]